MKKYYSYKSLVSAKQNQPNATKDEVIQLLELNQDRPLSEAELKIMHDLY